MTLVRQVIVGEICKLVDLHCSSSMGDSSNAPDEFTAEEESHFARRL